MNSKCSYVSPKGKACRAWSKKGTDRCANHQKDGSVEGVIVGLDEIKPYFEAEEAVSNSGHLSVDEPEALKAIRSDLEKRMSPEALNAALGVIRTLMGLPEIPVVEMAKVIDTRKRIDRQIYDEEKAKSDLILRSRAAIKNPDEIDPVARDRVLQKAMADVQSASASIAVEKQQMAHYLANEAKVTIGGPAQDEVFNVSGVTYLVPAGGQRRVPRTIATLLMERQKGYAEAAARKVALSSDLEIGMGGSLSKAMQSIDDRFHSHSLLSAGGGFQQVTDYLVAEEVIP